MRFIAAFMLFAMVASAACSATIETEPHGVILCEVEDDCEDVNDCTEDVCDAGRCRFFWTIDEAACVADDGKKGTCGDGVCHH